MQGVPNDPRVVADERDFDRFCELVQARDGYLLKPKVRDRLVRDGLVRDTSGRRAWLTDAGRKWLDDYVASGRTVVYDREG